MDERRKIMEMLAEKKVSAEEAAKLLEIVGEKENKTTKTPKFLKILVTNDTKSKPMVKVSIPLLLVKIGLKFVPKDAMLNANINNTKFDFSNIDWEELLKAAKQEDVTDLFNAEINEDDSSTTIVRIYVE